MPAGNYTAKNRPKAGGGSKGKEPHQQRETWDYFVERKQRGGAADAAPPPGRRYPVVARRGGLLHGAAGALVGVLGWVLDPMRGARLGGAGMSGHGGR